MKSTRWVAIVVAVAAVFLLIEGAIAVGGIGAANSVEVGPFVTGEDVAWARGLIPSMYLVATEGLILGPTALGLAILILSGRRWALTALWPASALLAVMATAAIALNHELWDRQGIFVVWSVLLWYQLYRWRKGDASALYR